MNLSSFLSKQFGIWMGVFMAGLMIGLAVVRIADLSPSWAFMAGLVFSIPAEVARDWLVDWWVVEQEVSAP